MIRVKSFQDEAKYILGKAEPNAVKLKQLLDTAIAIDVDLPEIPKLKQELHQCRWLEKVEETLQDTRQVSLDILRALLDEATMLSRKEGTVIIPGFGTSRSIEVNVEGIFVNGNF
jgi:hypothetical protein